MIKVIIVDDEPLAREGLRFYLDREEDIEILAECGSGTVAIRSIIESKPDLVFLDIQMPKVSGFDVISAVGPDNMPPVIFLTAYGEHAVDAFGVQALDYLLKPLEPQRLTESLERARTVILNRVIVDRAKQFRELLDAPDNVNSSQKNSNLRNSSQDNASKNSGSKNSGSKNTVSKAIGSNDNNTHNEQKIVVRSAGHVFFIHPSEILWVESGGDYITLHTQAKEHLLRDTMQNMEQRLSPYGFKRIHRSSIVNLQYIQELIANDNGDYQVILKNGTILKLSRYYRDALYQAMNAD